MLKNKQIGFCITGSFCAFKSVIQQIKKLSEVGANVIPIMSNNAYNLDTKFGKADDFINQIEEITRHKVICNMQEAELIGANNLTDVMAIIPCSGNTIAKLANGIADTPVLVSVKYHLRNGKNLVIGISTNDGLSANASNIGILLNSQHYYFVPFRQNNPITKPFSLSFEPELIMKSIEKSLENEQLQPLLL